MMLPGLYGLVAIVVSLALLGVLLWAIEQAPGDATIKSVIRIVVVVVVFFWLAGWLLSMVPGGPVPMWGRIR